MTPLDDLEIATALRQALFFCKAHARRMTRYECSTRRRAVMPTWIPDPRATGCLGCTEDGRDVVPRDALTTPSPRGLHKAGPRRRPVRSLGVGELAQSRRVGKICSRCRVSAMRVREYNHKRGLSHSCDVYLRRHAKKV